MTLGVLNFVIKKGELTMVKQPNRDFYGIKRLESKNAIIQKMATDFNLTAIIVENQIYSTKKL